MVSRDQWVNQDSRVQPAELATRAKTVLLENQESQGNQEHVETRAQEDRVVLLVRMVPKEKEAKTDPKVHLEIVASKESRVFVEKLEDRVHKAKRVTGEIKVAKVHEERQERKEPRE